MLLGLFFSFLHTDHINVHIAERRIFRKYMVKREPDHIILQMAFLDDEQMFDELSIRVVSEIVMDIGNKDTPPRLASISRLVDEVKHLESGKQLTLGGCRVRCGDFYFHSGEGVRIHPCPLFCRRSQRS